MATAANGANSISDRLETFRGAAESGLPTTRTNISNVSNELNTTASTLDTVASEMGQSWKDATGVSELSVVNLMCEAVRRIQTSAVDTSLKGCCDKIQPIYDKCQELHDRFESEASKWKKGENVSEKQEDGTYKEVYHENDQAKIDAWNEMIAEWNSELEGRLDAVKSGMSGLTLGIIGNIKSGGSLGNYTEFTYNHTDLEEVPGEKKLKDIIDGGDRGVDPPAEPGDPNEPGDPEPPGTGDDPVEPVDPADPLPKTGVKKNKDGSYDVESIKQNAVSASEAYEKAKNGDYRKTGDYPEAIYLAPGEYIRYDKPGWGKYDFRAGDEGLYLVRDPDTGNYVAVSKTDGTVQDVEDEGWGNQKNVALKPAELFGEDGDLDRAMGFGMSERDSRWILDEESEKKDKDYYQDPNASKGDKAGDKVDDKAGDKIDDEAKDESKPDDKAGDKIGDEAKDEAKPEESSKAPSSTEDLCGSYDVSFDDAFGHHEGKMEIWQSDVTEDIWATVDGRDVNVSAWVMQNKGDYDHQPTVEEIYEFLQEYYNAKK